MKEEQKNYFEVSLSLSFFGSFATTRSYESRIHSLIRSSGRLSCMLTVFSRRDPLGAVFFIHVITRHNHIRIHLTQFKSFFRVALQVDTFKLLNIADGKIFSQHFEAERIIIKRQIFGSTWKRETIRSVFKDIHSSANGCSSGIRPVIVVNKCGDRV